NQTESRYGIEGTDLGASFEYRNRIYFLFGDTWRSGHGNPNDDLDAIAFCTDSAADAGLHLTFFKTPPLLPIPQGGCNVPPDGVSWQNRMYVFFSTDHRTLQGRDIMGRSVLARSVNDGFDFTLLHEVSRYKFVNVSVSLVDAASHNLPGAGTFLVM